MRGTRGGHYGVGRMRSGLVVALGLGLACSFDSTGLGVGPTTNNTQGPSGSESTSGGPEPGVTSEAGDPGATSDSTAPVGTESEGVTGGPKPVCGDGAVDAGEDCDGAALAGASCASLGFAQGTLLCTQGCTFDTGQCSTPGCGDGTIDAGEACDCAGGACTAPQLNNSSCTSLPSPAGGNYSGGDLACDAGTCAFDVSKCIYCGDAIKNSVEACDAGDFAGATCESMGFAGGALVCRPDCTIDTAGCSNCGNQDVDAGEKCDGNDLDGKTCKSIDPGKYSEGALACAGDCGSFDVDDCNSGSCCDIGPKTNCTVMKIRDCVCKLNPGCCSNTWDGTCVLGAAICGSQC